MENHFLNNPLFGKKIKYWWVSLIIGIISVGLGLWAMTAPIEMLVALTIVFVISFLVSGIAGIVFSISNRNDMQGWGWSLASGIIDLIIAIILIAMPATSILVLILYVGFWIMFQSIWGISISFQLKKREIKGWGWPLVVSIFMFILSFFLIIRPDFAVGFIVMLASLSFLMYGFTRIYFAFKLRGIKKMLEDN